MTDAAFQEMLKERLTAIETSVEGLRADVRELLGQVREHDGRIRGIERWVRAKIEDATRLGERAEDAGQHRRNRLAILASGLFSAVVVWLTDHHPGVH